MRLSTIKRTKTLLVSTSLVVMFIVLMPLNEVLAQSIVTWDGGGGDNVWTTATNWDGDIVPSSGNDVVFNTASTFTVTSIPTLSINSLTISNGSVTLSGAATTLTVGGNAGTDLTIAASKGLTLNGVSITMANSATADISGTFTITTGTFNTNGTSVVSTVATTGSIVNSGTVTCTSTSKLIFEGSSSYTHARNGGTIPTADWNGATNTATSTCTVTGMTSTKPGGLVTTSNTFYHFTWNCASQSADLESGDQEGICGSGENFTCLGNLTITSSNNHIIAFSDVSNGSLSTLTVGGDFIMNGTANFILNYYTTPVNATIAGNFNVSAGDFDGHAYTGGTTNLTISGDLNVSGGIVHTTYHSFGITVNVANINVSGGDFHGAYGSGGSTFNISGSITVSSGRFYGSYNSGSPSFNLTGNINVSGGIFYGTFNSGSPTFNLTGNLLLTGSGKFYGSNGTGDPTFNIVGDLTVSGGSTTFYGSIYDVTGLPVFNIQGSVDLSTGTVGANDGSPTSTSYMCTFNLTGTGSNTLKLKTGLVYNASAAWRWTIASGRTVTLGSNIEIGGTGSACSFTNNGTLIMGTYTFPAVTTAAASFVNASGATLKTGNVDGLSALGTATGSVLVTGTRTYHAGGTYVFNGTSAQVTGNFSTSVAGLEFDNTSGVTLSGNLTATSTLTLTNGLVKTSSYTLTLGTSSSNGTLTGGTSSNYIVAYDSGSIGYFKRFVNSNTTYSFPIGDASNYTPLSWTLNSNGGLSSAYVITYTKASAIPEMNTTITSYINRFWEVSSSGITTPNYDISYTYVNSDIVTTETGMMPFKVSSGDIYYPLNSSFTDGNYWIGSGSVNTGTNTLTWTGVTSFSKFGGVVDVSIPLPLELVSFNARPYQGDVKVDWKTANEINNDFFTLERSEDGIYFNVITVVDGAGNSTYELTYSHIDHEYNDGINYYRLKKTDFDGKESYSNVVAVDMSVGQGSVIMTVNSLGQEVNQNYSGVVFDIYSDGSSVKRMQ